MSNILKESFIKRFLIYIGSIFLVGFAVSPFLWMLIVSVSTSPDFLVTGGFKFTLQNYLNIFSIKSLHFLSYLRNSLIISTITAVIVTVIVSFSGYAVSRLRFPGRKAIPLFILAMSMFPQISIVGFLYNFFSNLGLLNNHISLILPYIAWTMPITLWINMSYFSQIPKDFDKAALIDGANRIKILFKIIFPLALPGIFSSFLLVFIACFNEFLFAIMLTIDHTAQTLPVGIALFQGIHGEIPWGNLMAASGVAAIPLVLLTIVFQRYIVQGLTGGALKG